MPATPHARLVRICGRWRNDEPGGLGLEYADPTVVAKLAAHIDHEVPWILNGNTSDRDGFVGHLVQRLHDLAAATTPLSLTDAIAAMIAIRCLEMTGALTPDDHSGLLYTYVATPEAERRLVELHAPSRVEVIHPGNAS